jgi:putative sigma-54 modulation protein
MRINVVGKHFEVTDAIKAYGEQKASRLPRYFNGVQMITFTIGKTGAHATGEYDAELIINAAGGHDDFVSHAKASDPYAAIDLVVEKGERQLRDFKERLQA